jgi:hypothetical protein
MPNHFHLLIERKHYPLASVMKSLLSMYAVYYNKKYEKAGPVFQGRYTSILCQKEDYLLKLIRYINQNPVRAGFVDSPDRWKWSSYRHVLKPETSKIVDAENILKDFGKSLSAAVKKFHDYICANIDEESVREFYPRHELPILGSSEFIGFVTGKTKELRRKISPVFRFSLEELSAVLSGRYRVSMEDIRQKGGGRDVSRARAAIAYIASSY